MKVYVIIKQQHSFNGVDEVSVVGVHKDYHAAHEEYDRLCKNSHLCSLSTSYEIVQKKVKGVD